MSPSHTRSRLVVPILGIAALLLGTPACKSVPGAGGQGERGTATVYEVVAHGLSPSEAELLQEAFAVREMALDDFGVARYVDEDAFLSLPMKTIEAIEHDSEGDATFVFESFDFNAIADMRVLNRQDAVARTGETLSSLELLPRWAEAATSHTLFEATNTDGETLADQPIDTAVSYRFRLGEAPLEGPGAKIRVAFDGAGQVTQLLYSMRRLEPTAEVPIVGREEAVERCANWNVGSDRYREQDVIGATLAYYAPPLSNRIDRLEPSYRCETRYPNGAVGQVYFVPALVDATRPELPETEQERRPTTAASLSEPTAALVGRVDVGSEGTGPCSGLPNTAANVAGFNNRMSSAGVTVQFSWVDANAWEDDWKDPAFNGNDSSWVDDVDMAYWQGHGWPEGFSFSGCSSIDDTSMTNDDARWGNRDVEWVSLFTCLVLDAESGGESWAQRWGSAFHRLHQINSFDTVSYHSSQHGGIYANYLVRRPFLWWNDPMKVRQAWAQASIDDQPQQVVWATMGVIGSGGLVNYNDYFWGRGSVGPDVPAAQITGYWRLSGNS